MKYSASNKPIVCMQTQSTCYKGTTIGKPVGVLWHDTGAGNPYISRYVQPSDNDPDRAKLLAMIGKNKYSNDWNHIYHEAGVNYWIGKLADGSVAAVQALPNNYRPWGCGSGSKGSCNGDKNVQNSPFWIQFEICDDGYNNVDYHKKTYKEACELTAYLCKLFNIDPNGTVKYNGVTVPTILCHYDSHTLGLGSAHGDIYPWFKKYGKNMVTVRKDVTALLAAENETPPADPDPAPAENQPEISVGDLVSIKKDATYYSGKTIPAWVKAKKWFVESVSGDRVVINKSEDGSASIMSAIKASNLSVENQNEIVPVETETNEEDEVVTYEDFKKLMKQYREELQDNDCGKWSASARQWAKDTGMLAGGGNDANGNPNYMYEDFLTREQAVVLFYRFAKMCGMV